MHQRVEAVEPAGFAVLQALMERFRRLGQRRYPSVEPGNRLARGTAQDAMGVACRDDAADLDRDLTLGLGLIDEMGGIAEAVSEATGIADPRHFDAPTLNRLAGPRGRGQQ